MNALGIGGSTIEKELNAIQPKAHLAKPIQKEEFQARIHKACDLMKKQGIPAVYLHAGTNLFYFTGMRWNPSERMVGALLFPDGEVHYIGPRFEEGTILDFMLIKGPVHCWEEHESPYTLFVDILDKKNISGKDVAMDEATPFFIIDGILKEQSAYHLINAKPITAGCRMIKSEAEIAIMQTAMDITMEVQQAAARILKPGISAKEVTNFINEAHKRYGIPSGSYFCIVLFGVDSSFPHGVKAPKDLEENEIVLVDTGCVLHDYISDITRTYVYGEVSELQRKIWNLEKETQLSAFVAAQLGKPCSVIDNASRKTLEAKGLGPDYKLPGLPHRTGHGIGLDIHEWPYIARHEDAILTSGMCFSNEPMICVPNEFGIRLEDHIYMTEEGPKWFTQPAHSIDDPFGLSI
ncbi:Xaa-Pro peptidase family protein [Aquimarina sp. AU58]|uniref:M24 family metallopeptidase n=1 Tax=Aquimarina sp. AU58 TaxID=1874112 RepID=UPI000D65B51F|nr:Xaa-Pro peptidase family protein [Aquimarina sp. AU58]